MTAVLELRNLRKSFGGLPATNDVSLAVQAGERRLIIGPNGAGKTTLFNLITGDLRADSGSIRLFGDEVQRLPVHQRAHRGMGRTYQIITLFPRDTVAHNVVLSLLGLSPERWNPLAQLSYGEKRRVEIAMALAQKPRLLLLDEPLAGLSREERAAMQSLLAGIPRDITIVMIEHDMDTALSFAERITLLHYGQVLVEGTRAEVVAHPRTREVYLG